MEEAKLTVLDGERDDWLGYAVAVSGNVVVVGAINVNTPLLLGPVTWLQTHVP